MRAVFMGEEPPMKVISPKEVSIDSMQYRIEPYITSRGLILIKNLTALVGEPLIKMVAALPKGSDVKSLQSGSVNFTDLDINIEVIASALSTAFSKLDDATTEKLFRDILMNTFHGNQSCADKFDTHFQGQYRHLFRVVVKTLEAQYGDFLGEITGGLLKLPVKQV